MIKKIITVGLTALMVLSFAGCSAKTFDSKIRKDADKTIYTIAPKSGDEKSATKLRTDKTFKGLDETVDKYLSFEGNMSYKNFDNTVTEEKKLLSKDALKQFEDQKTQMESLKKQLEQYKIKSELQDYAIDKVKYAEENKEYTVEGNLDMKITSDDETVKDKSTVEKENFKLTFVKEGSDLKVQNVSISQANSK